MKNSDMAANSDHEARITLWKAIRHAAERIAHSCSVVGETPSGEHTSVQKIHDALEGHTW
jgi:hypothetical protein